MQKINRILSVTLMGFMSLSGLAQHTGGAPLHHPEIISSSLTAVKLAGNINDEYQEIGPIPSLDGKTMYFSRYHDPKNTGGADDEDIYYSEWDYANNHWGEAKNIGAPLNTKFPNFINSISPDGKTMLVGNIYNKNGTMSPGISLSYHSAEGWSMPQAIVIGSMAIQPGVSGCHASDDHKFLLLAYDHHKNCYGGEDIYVSFIQKDNNWSLPINLGPKINTKGLETAPFLADDDKTLYFTSDRSGGFGGTDIYVTTRLDDSWLKWSDPVNLGPKINTATNQSFFYISSRDIYFTSESDAKSHEDIYTMNIPDTTKKYVPEPVAVKTETENNENKNSEPIPTTPNISSSLVKFDVNQFSIDGGANPELVNMAKLLKEQPSVKIEIAGHADDTGSDEYNLALSKRRADCIFNYFKKEGIDSKRISVKNYGESKPLNSNQTEEEKAMNRRVEISVKDK